MSLQTTTLGTLFPRISIGGTPSRGNSKFFGGKHVWVSIRDMGGKSIISDSLEKLTDEGVKYSNCKQVKKGSLLFSFKLTVGRVAFAGVDLFTNEAIAAFDPIDADTADVDLEYLSLVLPAIAKGDSTKNSMGAALLNKEKIGNLVLPLPSPEEQRRIAARLRTQLANVAEARNAAQAQASDVQKLTTSILKASFEEVADAEMVRIGDVAPTTSGSTPSRSQKDYWEPVKYPWVKTGEVVFNPIRSTEEHISEKALRECSLTLLPPGTVLVAMYGQGKTRGQSAVLEVEATTNQACFAILPNDTFEPEYLQLWLRHSYEALRTLSEARGGNQSNLNGALLNAFEAPLIPRKQQQAIAKRIKQALSEAAALKARIHKHLNEIDLLPARLLTAAFNETEHA